jgi:hypothetical protein
MEREESRLANFVELGLEFENEESENVTKKLEEAGNNPEAAEEKFLDLIRTAQAELEIEKGEKLNEMYQKAKTEVKEISKEANGKTYRTAVRNLGDLTSADKKVIVRNLEALRIMEGKE